MPLIALAPVDDWTLASGLERVEGMGIRLAVNPLLTAALAVYHMDNNGIDAKGDFDLTLSGSTYTAVSPILGTHSLFHDALSDRTFNDTLLDTVPVAGFAIETWFEPTVTIDSGLAGTVVLVSKSNATVADRFNVTFRSGTGKLRLLSEEGNNGEIFIESTTATWTGGTKYHVVFNWGTSVGLELWVNNVREAFNASATTIMGNGTHQRFEWGNIEGNVLSFLGKLDESITYSRPLTPAEIAIRYNGGVPLKMMPSYSTTSPVAEMPQISIDQNTLDPVTPISVIENAIAAILGQSAGSLKYQWDLNVAGYNGTWITHAALRIALQGQAITNHINSLRIKVQFISPNGTQAADIVIASFVQESGGRGGISRGRLVNA